MIEQPPDPEQLSPSSLDRAVLWARETLEAAWAPDTALQGLYITKEDRPSRGQCGVSSLWFARQLCDAGYNAAFVDGELFANNHSLGGYCWVEVEAGNGRSLIIDLTRDQFPGLVRMIVHVGYTDRQGMVQYRKQAAYHPYASPHKKLNARCEILTKRIEARSPAKKLGDLCGRFLALRPTPRHQVLNVLREV